MILCAKISIKKRNMYIRSVNNSEIIQNRKTRQRIYFLNFLKVKYLPFSQYKFLVMIVGGTNSIISKVRVF